MLVKAHWLFGKPAWKHGGFRFSCILVWKKGELRAALGRGEASGPDGQTAYRTCGAILAEQGEGGLKEIGGVADGALQLLLTLIPEERGIPDPERYRAAKAALLPKPGGYRAAEGVQGDLNIT